MTQPQPMTQPQHRSYLRFGTGLAAGLLVGLGMVAGTVIGISMQHREPTVTAKQLPDLILDQRMLQASATHGGKTLAAATGAVAPDSEGIYFLDYITGTLQCFVLYPNTGKFGAKFAVNVFKDLAQGSTANQGKDPNLLIVTGQTSFRNPRASMSVVYIVDANSGNFVAYGLPWNRNLASSKQPQTGSFIVLGTGKARQLPEGE